LTAQEWADTLPILKESIKKIDAVYHPIGYRINMSIGEIGGANQPPHFYLRIVPRYKENYGSYGGGIYHDRLPSSEQKERLRDALLPDQNKVIAEKGKLIAKLHGDIGFMSISTKQHLPNNLQTLDAEI
jgi:diadenosine tetraphosphate (Ap4A) HIT family hydrolase